MANRRVFIPDAEFEINPEIVSEGFTQSEMQTWDNCPERWYLGYNLQLHKVGSFAWALTYGGWIHSALQEFYASRGKRWALNCDIRDRKYISQDVIKDEEYWSGVAEVQMDIYTSHFKQDFKIWKPITVEEVVDVVVDGLRLKGMVDMFAQDLTVKKSEDYYVWDHKTTYKIDRTTVMGWDFRFQFMFYCWLATKVEKWKKRRVRGFMINAIRKPNIRQNKGETLPAFLQRLQSDMRDRPEFYFYRDKLMLKQNDLDHFEHKILRPKLQRIRLLLDPTTPTHIKELLIRNKNTDHCISKFGSVCPFLPACQHGLAIEMHQYRKREVKHMELMSEAPED